MTQPAATRTFPYINRGDEITCDLVTGMVGVHGTVVDVLVKNGGREIAVLLLDLHDDKPPLAIRGDLVAIWRQGAPVQVRVPQQQPSGLVVPQIQMVPGNGGRPQG